MTERTKGYLALWVAVLLWATPPLFIKWLSGTYDAFTQNFLRYAVGCVFLVLVRLVARRGEPFFPPRAVMRRLLWPLVPNVVFQTANVFALYYAAPGLVALVGKLAVVFAAVFAFVLVREERGHILSARFIVGTCLALAGVAGLYVFKLGVPERGFKLGVLLAIVGAAGWGGYIVAVKHAVRTVTPSTSFTVVSLYTAIVFAVFAFLWGHPAQALSAGWVPTLVLVVSGILCLSVAHVAYYYAIERLGAAIPAVAILVSPVITVIASRWLFREHLDLLQMVSGAVLLSGAFLSLGRRPAPTDPDRDPHGG